MVRARLPSTTDGCHSSRGGGLDGTRNNLKALVATLKNTPEEKIEALVGEFDEDLTAYLNKFNALGSGASIEKFRLAQIMSGLAVSIMAKAGVKG